MCKDHPSEDFQDQPSVEERYPERLSPEELEEYLRWLDEQEDARYQDLLLEQQEYQELLDKMEFDAIFDDIF